VDWGKLLPIPKTKAERFPEVKTLLDQGLGERQFLFSADNLNEAGKILQGPSAFKDGTTLSTEMGRPEGVPLETAPERPEEFAPGLDAALLELIQATAEQELKTSR
jgi:Mn-containing catalase